MTLLIDAIIKDCKMVADIGCGPHGSYWYNLVPTDCKVDAYDLYNEPKTMGNNIEFHNRDVTILYKETSLKESYDLVVADHIFEHVDNPELLAKSINHLLKEGGFVHIGIPDATNFTDKFYSLIHRHGGGHIQKFSKDSFVQLMTFSGFKLIEVKPWPDSWTWFERLYSLKENEVSFLTQDDIQYMVDVFRRELTPEKGYLYGWEYVFEKINISFQEPLDIIKGEDPHQLEAEILATIAVSEMTINSDEVTSTEQDKLIQEQNIRILSLKNELFAREQELLKIYNSRGWGLLKKYYELKNMIKR